MNYVFDTSTLSVIFRHYYYERFPSFWEKFNLLLNNNKICSVREVRRELEERIRGNQLEGWIKQNSLFFKNPSVDEMFFVKEIYKVPNFQHNLDRKKQLKGGPFADPFVIAKAKCEGFAVVSQEGHKENAAKIPNICEHFGIECTDLEGFLRKENWSF